MDSRNARYTELHKSFLRHLALCICTCRQQYPPKVHNRRLTCTVDTNEQKDLCSHTSRQIQMPTQSHTTNRQDRILQSDKGLCIAFLPWCRYKIHCYSPRFYHKGSQSLRLPSILEPPLQESTLLRPHLSLTNRVSHPIHPRYHAH